MAYGAILGKKNITQAQLNNAAPYNWLDNSDFTNLVAQAGINGKHGTTTYMADRWIVTGGTPSYTAGTGVSFNGTIVQKLEFAPSGEVTVVAGTSEGIITSNDIPANIKVQLSYSPGNQVIIDSNGQATIQWVALYEGTYSAVTAPAYHPKGYVAELAECQRYYRVVQLSGLMGYVKNENTLAFNINLSGMRLDAPTVDIITADNAVIPGNFFPYASTGAYIEFGGRLVLSATVPANLTAYTPIGLFFCSIDLVADL